MLFKWFAIFAPTFGQFRPLFALTICSKQLLFIRAYWFKICNFITTPAAQRNSDLFFIGFALVGCFFPLLSTKTLLSFYLAHLSLLTTMIFSTAVHRAIFDFSIPAPPCSSTTTIAIGWWLSFLSFHSPISILMINWLRFRAPAAYAFHYPLHFIPRFPTTFIL